MRCFMKLKNSYFSTLRENVKDEETVSGNLLTRSGMIKKTSSGIYMYLPLGYKVIKNIENIRYTTASFAVKCSARMAARKLSMSM